MAIAIGDTAPPFKLPSQDGAEISSVDLLAKGPLVVFFYPKDETTVCTAEACSFRDNYEAFQQAGATVVGISSDSVDSHRRFAAKHGFQFLLLSDSGGKLRKTFGVTPTLGIVPGRVTYVVDSSGIVRHVFSSQLKAGRHIEEALRVVQSLKRSGAD